MINIKEIKLYYRPTNSLAALVKREVVTSIESYFQIWHQFWYIHHPLDI